MTTGQIVLIIVLLVSIALLVGLYFLGKRMDKKNAENQEMMRQNAQVVSMLIIDKKKMKMNESGLPASVLETVPKYLRGTKTHVVKAKVGPKNMTLMVDPQIYPIIPVKKEVKATVSGIYITGVKGVRGPLDTPEEKKGFFARFKKEK